MVYEEKKKEMKVCVLISCMHQKDHTIVERTNVQTNVVVVNQCDEDSIEEWNFVNNQGETCHAKFISTKERGLSRSRNMALKNAWDEFCLICDDDEVLENDYEKTILNAYIRHKNRDVILFIVERKDLPHGKKYPKEEGKVGFKQILQSSSVQVTFRRNIILNKRLQFDILLGSGTGNGGGEDNKFLLDCKNAKLSIFYIPICIGAVMPSESVWFNGFNKQYMINRGWATRRSLGTYRGLLYIMSFGFLHYKKYCSEMSMINAYKYLFKGYFEKKV